MPSILTKETRELSCVLSEKEVADHSSFLANKIQEYQEVEAQMKSVAGDYQAKLKAIDSAINLAARKVSTKSELRTVDCEWTYDWETNKKHLTRKDTGEMILEEAIRDYEHQRHFEDLQKEQEQAEAAPQDNTPTE